MAFHVDTDVVEPFVDFLTSPIFCIDRLFALNYVSEVRDGLTVRVVTFVSELRVCDPIWRSSTIFDSDVVLGIVG